jgi:hypothetical protein
MTLQIKGKARDECQPHWTLWVEALNRSTGPSRVNVFCAPLVDTLFTASGHSGDQPVVAIVPMETQR